MTLLSSLPVAQVSQLVDTSSHSQNSNLSSSRNSNNNNLSNDVDIQVQARELRAALDDQLERMRRLSLEEQLEMTVDEQLAEFLVLVSQYPEEAQQLAVLMTDEARGDDSQRLLIHLACDTNAPLEIIQWLLQQDTQKTSILRTDAWLDLPLHTACSRKYVEVVRSLLESDTSKATLLTKDHQGAIPLHMACRYNAPAEIIQMLLDSDSAEKKSLMECDMHQQLPIHMGARCNMPPESIQLLLDYDVDKKTLWVPDNAERIPLHVAFLRNTHSQVLKIILQGMFRIAKRGLDLWKQDMTAFIASMEVHERDFNTSYKMEMTRNGIRELMERALLLELAIWKTSCLSPMTKFGTMQEISELEAKDPSFSATEFKHERRIKSGAEIIVPGVISFVEGETIVKLMEQYSS